MFSPCIKILIAAMVWMMPVIALTFFAGSRLWAESMAPGHTGARIPPGVAKDAGLSGEAGFYHEEKDFNRDRFVEDGEPRDLPDERFTAAFLNLDYRTNVCLNLSLGAGMTGYLFINDAIPPDPETADRRDLLFRDLYLQYEWSRTSVKLGRQEVVGTTFEGFYFEALSIISRELDSVSAVLLAARKAAEVDLPDIIDFRDVNFDNRDAGNTFYLAEFTWHLRPDLVTVTPYYMRQGDLFDLYGTHLEFTQEWPAVVLGLEADYYRTDEDRKNGITDAKGRVRDTSVFHIKPTVSADPLTFGIGYIGANRDVGAREGDLIDDYFNPLNEGDMLYQPGAKTWYGELLWQWGRFNLELGYGHTDYRDELGRLKDREFNIRTELTLAEDLLLEADFARVDSEGPEGSFHKFETEIIYAF